MNNNNNNNQKEKILDYLLGNLDAQESTEFQSQMDQNLDLKSLVDEMHRALDIAKEIDSIHVPKPSQAMDKSFYSMLNTAKKQQISPWKKSLQSFSQLFTFTHLKPVLYGAAMLSVGIYLGQNYQPRNIKTEINNNYSNNRSNEMQNLAVVSMLQLPSASTRLQAVSLVENSNKANDKVMSSLFYILNNDSNTNVRLAVLDALIQFSNTPTVRAQLVNSITNQDSPMVQVAIAELMLYLQESKAIPPLKKLLDSKNLIEPAREKILLAVNEII